MSRGSLNGGWFAPISIIGTVRPLNGLMAAIGALVGWTVGNGDYSPPSLHLILLMGASFTFVSAANILNDLGDLEPDRTVHPKRAIVSGNLGKGPAKMMMASLFLTSFILVLIPSILEPFSGILLLFFTAFLSLVLYEAKVKAMGFIGNCLVAALTPFPFLLGASVSEFNEMVVLLCTMAFMVNLSREVLKDISDTEGDRGRRRTVPIVHGKVTALTVSSLSLYGGVFTSFVPTMLGGTSMLHAVLLLGADLLLVLGDRISLRDTRLATAVLKSGMVLALFAFLVL